MPGSGRGQTTGNGRAPGPPVLSRGRAASAAEDGKIDTAETTTVADDPLGPTDGRFLVVRGASWRSATATDLRVAARNYSAEARDDLGFRIVRNLE